MKAQHMEITNELLAAYASGNVSDSERIAVRQYLAEHPEELESVMIMMDEDLDIQLDDKDREVPSRSFDEELDVLLDEIEDDDSDTNAPSVSILPLMSKAAQNEEDNLCAIRCEGYALRKLGINVSDKTLQQEAEQEGWLSSEGTSLQCIGLLSEKHGMAVSRQYGCTINDIDRALNKGEVVIAVIDKTELTLLPHAAEMMDNQYGKIPNHAVILQSIDYEQNCITLLNPGDKEEIEDYALDIFFEAWNDSANYLIIGTNNATV